FRGSHDGYSHLPDAVRYARQVGLKRTPAGEFQAKYDPFMIVSDEFVSNGSHECELNFTFDPGCLVTAGHDRVVAFHRDGHKLEMFVHGTASTEVGVKDTVVSDCYGEQRPARAAMVRSAGSGLHQVLSVFIPSRGGRSAVQFKHDQAGRWIEVTVDS